MQEQSSGGVLQNRCSKRFCNIHRKTPVLEFLFNKVAGLKACNFIKQKFQPSRFPMNIAKLFRPLFRRTSPDGCFCKCALESK